MKTKEKLIDEKAKNNRPMHYGQLIEISKKALWHACNTALLILCALLMLLFVAKFAIKIRKTREKKYRTFTGQNCLLSDFYRIYRTQKKIQDFTGITGRVGPLIILHVRCI